MTDRLVRVAGSAVILFLVAALVAALVFLYRENLQKRRLSALYRQALCAGPDTVTVVRDTVIYCPVYFKPRPLPAPDTVVLRDTVPVLHYYDETFWDSTLKMHWQALGNLRWIRFSDYSLPIKTTTITRQVIRPDTVRLGPSPVRGGLYAKMHFAGWETFPGLEAGVQLSFLERGGVTLGCARDPRGAVYFSLGGFFYLF